MRTVVRKAAGIIYPYQSGKHRINAKEKKTNTLQSKAIVVETMLKKQNHHQIIIQHVHELFTNMTITEMIEKNTELLSILS